jgi:hypothetical protein
MRVPFRNALPLLPLGLAWSIALAQAPPAPGPASRPLAGAETPLYDPAQLPSFTGRIQQFTLTPRGEIDGMILSDGTEVKTPPHLSTAIAYSVRPGDALIIHGLRAAGIPLIQAVSITDHTSGRTILDTDTGPGPRGPRPSPPPPPGFAGVQLVEVQGRIQMSLHGPRGETNGVLLSDGTVLRLPPDAFFGFASLLEPGKTVVAEGTEVSNAIGKVLEVSQIGPSREQLNYVTVPPPGPAGGPAPPPIPPPPPSPPRGLR